jgi:hypothetical protein
MTLFDVDGSPARAAGDRGRARAVVGAILRHGIGGSIGIDFPTLEGKAPRQAVAEARSPSLRADGGQRFRLPPDRAPAPAR